MICFYIVVITTLKKFSSSAEIDLYLFIVEHIMLMWAWTITFWSTINKFSKTSIHVFMFQQVFVENNYFYFVNVCVVYNSIQILKVINGHAAFVGYNLYVPFEQSALRFHFGKNKTKRSNIELQQFLFHFPWVYL